ncbi:MAG: hypothetical protein RMY64_32635 [Nostoc sp. DedQUE08]|uniref:hypothetical protein n=1 Tax=unclassified Nostoc TaxID=2593658 RepID=UPI002AD1F9FF|nr:MULTISPECIES: hypothetical protein [unclassified Nostoc]MDZ8070303.1 hypothetical protein [Nostoc sp. DedQUE08]MDZ8094095.1 hypothetical protein [Nostoc sp. DedQUE05]
MLIKALNSFDITRKPVVDIDSSNKGIVMLLPLSLDTWQSTLQARLHGYLKSLD